MSHDLLPLDIVDGNSSNSGSACSSMGEISLVSMLLEEQQSMSAVETFSKVHEAETIPTQSQYYSSLMPASPPKEGQQYAFGVDLDRCSGCKACVTACHSLNGLDEDETWRKVGLLSGGTTTNPAMQHVTTACHHCIDAPCMKGCPVDAYEKDPITGIVKHLDDQCFGCQYCTLTCPYDVPQFHAKKGIVRKCDMCSDRLKEGEAPACVQACPHEAISIEVVDVQQVIEDAEANLFLPGAPEPSISYPTTNYKSSQVFPRNMLPADYYSVSPQHPHWPLIIMLVLTQLSVGAFTVGLILESFLSASLVEAVRPFHATSALVFGLLALASSTMHLGRPLYAFRAIIGLRHSWLSREILAFGVFAKLAILYAAFTWLAVGAYPEITEKYPWLLDWTDALAWGVAVSGAVGIFCSVMIYVFTQRVFWSFGYTGAKFLMTSLVMGLSCMLSTMMLFRLFSDTTLATQLLDKLGPITCQSLIAMSVIKLVFEASIFFRLTNRQNSSMKRSAMLMMGALSKQTALRFAFGFLGGIVMPSIILLQSGGDFGSQNSILLTLTVTVLFVSCLYGELMERYLFFAASSSPRMPGSIRH